MKVLIISTFDSIGGAAVAAKRLMHALIRQGVDANMLVLEKKSQDENIYSINTTICSKIITKLKFFFERLIIFICNKFDRENLFKVSIANIGTDLSSHPLVSNADIINIHWTNQGFLSISNIKKLSKLGKPLVWTMHDMWPITSICHHSWGCDGFMNSCGYCQFLNSSARKDLSSLILKKKQNLYVDARSIHLVAVSHWLKGMANKSKLTKGISSSVIPNAIDISKFSKKDMTKSREKMELPQNSIIILVGAARLDDPIKGIGLLKKSLCILKEKNISKDTYLVLFGNVKDKSFFNDIPIPYIWKGLISDPESIATLYSAADITVVPSLYETFGQTISESMACGCPVVSFDNSGQKDIISHLSDGYLAKYNDVKDFAEGILWLLNHMKKESIAVKCREKIENNFSYKKVAEKYINLFKDLLNNNK